MEHEPRVFEDVWTRADRFGDRWRHRSLDEFVAPTEPVQWTSTNPYDGAEQSDLIDWMAAQQKWRHHHDIPALTESPDFYTAYSNRVDGMIQMLGDVLENLRLEIPATSFCDLGAAEGYTTNFLNRLGARDVDACDVNDRVIERLWRVRAYHGLRFGSVGWLDLERVDWSRSMDRTYDVVLALGLIYHMENPLLFARNLFQATRRYAIVESDTPNFPSNERFRGYGNVYMHRDQVTLAAGNVRYLCELRPDRLALAEILLNAGFDSVYLVRPSNAKVTNYFASGEKTLVLAAKGSF